MEVESEIRSEGEMSIKIPERPIWNQLVGSPDRTSYNKVEDWWDSEIQPLVDELENARVIYGDLNEGYFGIQYDSQVDTHKALLIGIEEIEPDSFEKLVRDSIHSQVSRREFNERAKKLLGEG